MPAGGPDAKIDCPTSHHLQLEGDALASFLNLGEKEETWDKIEKALIRFAGVVRGGGYKHLPLFVDAMGRKGCGMRIAEYMLSDRGRLSGAAVELLQTFAPRLGASFAPLVQLYFEQLVKLCGRPNKVVLKRAEKCLTTIIANCHLPTILFELRKGLSDEAATCRRLCSIGIERALAEWETDVWTEKSLLALEEGLRRMATDKDPEVRQTGKRVWAGYMASWPERVDDFSAPLTPTVRRYLNLPAASNAPAKGKGRAPAAGPPRTAPTTALPPAHVEPVKVQHHRVAALAHKISRAALKAGPPPPVAIDAQAGPSRPARSPPKVTAPLFEPKTPRPRDRPVPAPVPIRHAEPIAHAPRIKPSSAPLPRHESAPLANQGRSVSHNDLPNVDSAPSLLDIHPLRHPGRPDLPHSSSTTSVPAEAMTSAPVPPRLGRFASGPVRIVRPAPSTEEVQHDDADHTGAGDAFLYTPSGATVLRAPVRPPPTIGHGRRPLGQAQRRAVTAPTDTVHAYKTPARNGVYGRSVRERVEELDERAASASPTKTSTPTASPLRVPLRADHDTSHSLQDLQACDQVPPDTVDDVEPVPIEDAAQIPLPPDDLQDIVPAVSPAKNAVIPDSPDEVAASRIPDLDNVAVEVVDDEGGPRLFEPVNTSHFAPQDNTSDQNASSQAHETLASVDVPILAISHTEVPSEDAPPPPMAEQVQQELEPSQPVIDADELESIVTAPPGPPSPAPALVDERAETFDDSDRVMGGASPHRAAAEHAAYDQELPSAPGEEGSPDAVLAAEPTPAALIDVSEPAIPVSASVHVDIPSSDPAPAADASAHAVSSAEPAAAIPANPSTVSGSTSTEVPITTPSLPTTDVPATDSARILRSDPAPATQTLSHASMSAGPTPATSADPLAVSASKFDVPMTTSEASAAEPNPRRPASRIAVSRTVSARVVSGPTSHKSTAPASEPVQPSRKPPVPRAAAAIAPLPRPVRPLERKPFRPATAAQTAAAKLAKDQTASKAAAAPAPAPPVKPSTAAPADDGPRSRVVSAQSSSSSRPPRVVDTSDKPPPAPAAVAAPIKVIKTSSSLLAPTKASASRAAAPIAHTARSAHPAPTVHATALPPVRKEKIKLKAALPSFRPVRSNGTARPTAPATGTGAAHTRPPTAASATRPAARVRPEAIPLPSSPADTVRMSLPFAAAEAQPSPAPSTSSSYRAKVRPEAIALPASPALAHQHIKPEAVPLPSSPRGPTPAPMLNDLGLPMPYPARCESSAKTSSAATASEFDSASEAGEDDLAGITFKVRSETTAQPPGSRPKVLRHTASDDEDDTIHGVSGHTRTPSRQASHTPTKTLTPKYTPGRRALVHRDANLRSPLVTNTVLLGDGSL